jgi:hypothetical protein
MQKRSCEREVTPPVLFNSHQKQYIVPGEPHCMLIFELTDAETVLPVILQKLRHRGVEVKEQCSLRDERIILDCQFEKPDRIYQLVLLTARVHGVISVERMVSKGIITSISDT